MTGERWTLEDVCEKKSSNLMQKDLRLGTGEFPIYGASGLLGYVDFFQQNEEYVAVVKDGAGVGRAMLLPAKSSCIGTMQYLIPKEGVLSHFLYYAIESMNLAKYNTGATIPHIYFRDYKKETLPRLGLNEQEEIVAVLDKLAETIRKRRGQLHFFDDLVKSQFIEMFESKKYPDCPIKELVTGRVESVRKRYKPEDRIRYVDISSIDNKLNQMTGYTEYSLQEAPSRAQQCIEKGDILVSTVRPNLRNIAMNTFDDDHMVASSGFCVLRATSCNRSYLLAALLLDKFSRKMSELTTGANYPAIKDSDVLGYRIPRPPIERQNEFARFVERTDKSKILLAIKLFFHLYTAICLKAFEKSSQMMYNHR